MKQLRCAELVQFVSNEPPFSPGSGTTLQTLFLINLNCLIRTFMSLSASDSQLKELSKTAGVDLNALRAKYSSARYQDPSEESKQEVFVSDEERARIKAAHGRLDEFKICNSCQGLGIVKEVYNHIVRDKTCPECDGESILIKSVFRAETAKAGLEAIDAPAAPRHDHTDNDAAEGDDDATAAATTAAAADDTDPPTADARVITEAATRTSTAMGPKTWKP